MFFMYDIYNDMVSIAMKHEFLYHYTDMEGYEGIKSSNTLWLKNLIDVNDCCENCRIKSVWKNRLYVACFTYADDITDHLKNYYGKDGVRLTFEKNDFIKAKIYADEDCTIEIPPSTKQVYGLESNTDVCWVFNRTLADIHYVDDLNEFEYKGEELNAGLIKLKKGIDKYGQWQNWEEERETRIRVALIPSGIGYKLEKEGLSLEKQDPSYEKIYMDISGLIKDVIFLKS